VLGVQVVGALVSFGLALRPERPARASAATVQPEPAGFETA
jgi:hypothetical protein